MVILDEEYYNEVYLEFNFLNKKNYFIYVFESCCGGIYKIIN